MLIFEGSEASYLNCLNEKYSLFNAVVAADFLDEEWGGIKMDYCHNMVINDLNLSAFNDETFMYKCLEVDSYFFKFASEQLKNNREFVKTAVRHLGCLFNESLELKYGCPLEYVGEQFRDDDEIVTIAMTEDPAALQFASLRLRSDREFIFKALEINPYNFKHTSDDLRNDKEIVRYAINNRGWLLYGYYNPESKYLCCDEDHVNEGDVFEFASDELKADRDFVLEIVKVSGIALNYASEILRNDRELILAALSNTGTIFKYLSPKFQDDDEIVRQAIKQSGYFLCYASERIQRDKNIVLQAIQKDFHAIEYVATDLLDDPEIIATHQQAWDKFSQNERFLHIPVHNYHTPANYKICCIRTFGIDHSDKDIIAIKDDLDAVFTIT